MRSSLLSLTWMCAVAPIAAIQQAPPTTECAEYDRIEYSAPRKDWPGSILVERVVIDPSATPYAQTAAQRSPHGTVSYIVHEPDTTRPGPWTTLVEVFGNKARPIHLRIRLAEHISGGVRVQWLNEKLLWVQMWRGRIVSTDVILDVDTQEFVYEQDANYNSLYSRAR